MVNTKKRVYGEDLYDAPLTTNLNGSIAVTNSGKNAYDHAAERIIDTNDYVPSGKNAYDHTAQRTPTSEPTGSYNGSETFNYGSFSYNPYVRGNFSYKDAPEYVNRYQQQIDELSNEILHWQGFDYNVNSDPLYQQYAQTYNRNGQNAMRNTLAQMAARTGGMASSYAGTAAQNAYNEYMQQLNDKVPELYQLAYGMYNDRLNKRRTDLSMLEALEQGDYNKYVDLLGQYNTDRNVAYNVWNTTEGSKEDADRAKMNLDYNVWKAQQDNAYNQWKYNQDLAYDQWKYQQEQNSKDAEYQAQLQQLQELANQQNTTNEAKINDLLKQIENLKAPKQYGNGGYKSTEEIEKEKLSIENQVNGAIREMYEAGAPAEEIMKAVNDAYDSGLLTRKTGSEALTEMMNKYSLTSRNDVFNGAPNRTSNRTTEEDADKRRNRGGANR